MTQPAITLSRHLDGDPGAIRLRLITAWCLVPLCASTPRRRNRRGKFSAPVIVSKSITAWRVGQMRQWLKDSARYQQAQHEPLLPRGRHDR